MAADWTTKRRYSHWSGSTPRRKQPYTEIIITHHFRSQRMAKLERLVGITASTRVLDVGGTRANWDLLAVRPKVTILNLPRGLEAGEASLPWIFADGCRLPFRDQSFDVV